MSIGFYVFSAFAASGAIAGIGHAIAAIIRAYFDGRSKLLRAERGDPEPPSYRTTISGILGRNG
jgi:hypothetical protein